MDCLFVIDVQNGFVSAETQAVVPRILKLIDLFDGELVISTRFINTEHSGFTDIMHWQRLKRSPETDLCSGIEERSGIVIEKPTYSACTAEVVRILRERQITQAYVCGIDTDCCVLKTAMDLFELNIRPVVLTGYCASNGGAASHQAAIKVLERTIGLPQLCGGDISAHFGKRV